MLYLLACAESALSSSGFVQKTLLRGFLEMFALLRGTMHRDHISAECHQALVDLLLNQQVVTARALTLLLRALLDVLSPSVCLEQCTLLLRCVTDASAVQAHRTSRLPLRQQEIDSLLGKASLDVVLSNEALLRVQTLIPMLDPLSDDVKEILRVLELVDSCLQLTNAAHLDKMTVRLLSLSGVLFDKSIRWLTQFSASLPTSRAINSGCSSELLTTTQIHTLKDRYSLYLHGYRTSNLLHSWLKRERLRLTRSAFASRLPKLVATLTKYQTLVSRTLRTLVKLFGEENFIAELERLKSLPQAEALEESNESDVSQVRGRRQPLRKRQRRAHQLRSRNQWIDEALLEEENGQDDYADLEDWIVGNDCEE
mmetsp:Transcript_44/g.131  ORF Transcript_44/g.131 Transcript_44/m.131 type:complete len:369 (+) Transcript_44:198-1304(+)